MQIINTISVCAIPGLIFIILIYGLTKNVKLYDQFVEGAKEGIATTVRVIPPLVGLLVAIGVFRASGALDLLIYAIKPLTDLLKIPPEVLPLMFMRPISGSASQAITFDILKNYGPDSFVGKVASTMMGSSETIFYTLAVYFGSVGIKNIKHTLKIALIAEFVAILCSVWVNGLIFNWK